MMTQKHKLRLLGGLAGIAAAFFFVTATVGWLRERDDVRAQRELYLRPSADIWAQIDQVQDGVSPEAFKAAFPNAYEDPDSGEWIVSIPTGYDDGPACTNHRYQLRFFKVDGEVVKPVEAKGGSGIRHADKFEGGGPWYYFRRAWRSGKELHEVPSDDRYEPANNS